MNKIKEIRFIDLFSGIGGFRLGLERAGGFKHVWSNDINKPANQIYTSRFGEEGHYSGDIRGVNESEIPDHDLLCGGFPCQSFSSAGKRKGFEDTRGTLFFEILRIAASKRPSLLLLENVRGLLNHDGGRTFGIILQRLDALGYWVEWKLLNSSNFGVPQNRQRVFIVGHLRGSGGREVFPIGQNDKPVEKTKEKRNGAIGVTLTKGNASGWNARGNYVIAPEIARTFTAGGNSGGLHSDMDVIAVSASRMPLKYLGRNEKNFIKDEAYTVDASQTGGVMVPIGSQKPTVRSSGRGSIDRHAWDTLTDGFRIRRLTPTECERLQGFPDGFTKFGYMKGNTITTEPVYDWREIVTEPDGDIERRWVKVGEKEIDPILDSVRISDTQRYKCLGNAVTVNVIEYLGGMLKASINSKSLRTDCKPT